MAEEQPPATNPEPAVSAAVSAPASAPATEPSADAASAAEVDPSAVDEILKQASFEDAAQAMAGQRTNDADTVPQPTDAAPAAAAAVEDFKLPNFQQVMQDAQVSSIDLLRDVDLNVKIELGRARMLVEDVLKLGEGSVVELDKLAGDRVDVCVKGRLVARGELRVLPDNFGWPVHGIAAAV